MDLLQFLVPLGWLEAAGPMLPFAVLALALANLVTRHLAHSSHVAQAQSADSLDQYLPHLVSNVALVLVCFLFTLVQPTGGAILSTLAVTVFIADLFEFEARNLEARNDMTIERPKSSIVASSIVVLYAVYYVLTVLGATFWGSLFA